MDNSLEEYATICRGLTSTSDLQREATRFFTSRGCKILSYHHIPPVGAPHGDRGTLVFAHGFPDDWVQRYIGERLFEVDPVIRISQARTKPFFWMELLGSKDITPREQHYLDILVESGLGNGLVVPVFGPHGRNGYCGMGYGLGVRLPCESEVTILHEASQLSHLKFCELNPLSVESTKLSEREKETLRNVAKGLSNSQIAREMGVSSSTVDTNLRRIFNKLGVHDRVSAALRGIVIGIYD